MLEHADARESGLLDIGQAAAQSGVSAKMIRHYEAIGLLARTPRTSAGYRLYDKDAVETLRLIKRARFVGLPMEEIRELVGVWQDKSASTAFEVARKHLRGLEERRAELRALMAALQRKAPEKAIGDHAEPERRSRNGAGRPKHRA